MIRVDPSFFFFEGGGGGCLVGYCIMIEIRTVKSAQMIQSARISSETCYSIFL